MSKKTEKLPVFIVREKGARERLHKANGLPICTDGKAPELHRMSA